MGVVDRACRRTTDACADEGKVRAGQGPAAVVTVASTTPSCSRSPTRTRVGAWRSPHEGSPFFCGAVSAVTAPTRARGAAGVIRAVASTAGDCGAQGAERCQRFLCKTGGPDSREEEPPTAPSACSPTAWCGGAPEGSPVQRRAGSRGDPCHGTHEGYGLFFRSGVCHTARRTKNLPRCVVERWNRAGLIVPSSRSTSCPPPICMEADRREVGQRDQATKPRPAT
jgi:hypothetical protein